ncbi:hypothetical protein V5O48_000856 [Marasmius crinis-equi]|uniref:C2H2-type domain-containing protein n=1 Tax=Marasmius crinis-equi TaxID=585013 RepID=A0ABR3G160_9AGAR
MALYLDEKHLYSLQTSPADALDTTKRRDSRILLQKKIQDDDGEFEELRLARQSFADEESSAGIRPDTLASHPSPLTASSSSVSSPQPGAYSSDPEQCGHDDCDYDEDDNDSDSDTECDPWVLDMQENSREHFVVENGRVYRRSAMTVPNETDTPFNPNASTHDASSYYNTPAIAPDDYYFETEMDILAEDPPTIPQPPTHAVSEPSAAVVPRRRALKRRMKEFQEALDEEDEEDKNPTDDEYCPSPTLPPRKKTRTSRSSSRRPATYPSKRRTADTKRARLTPASRNIQSTSPELMKAVTRRSAEECDFICPECGWQQANKRMPDYQRHLRTHARPNDQDQTRGWWCKGVRVAEQHLYNIPSDAKTYYFQNEQRIGGCLLTFSRRDALKRHLDNSNVCCIGRPCPANED